MILLERAIRYAENVVAGKEVTTKEVIIQCKWFLKDLEENQYNENFQYYFDKNKLKIINNLLKLFNFATGFVAGKQILTNLADFQCFFLANIFGWRFKDNSNKFRYNDITLYIARKNAKTALVAITFLLLMLTEQEYSEFYSICLNKELAAEIRKAMVQILEASPLIAKHFDWSDSEVGIIKCKITKSFFKPRTSQSGKNNSIRPAAFVSDEHGNFSDNGNFTAMKSGQRNVINPLLFRTTTAYAIDHSIMQDDLEYIKKVFQGIVKNERQFALLYYAEEENLWNDIGIHQANPLRIEENYNIIREERERALIQESLQTEYLTKSMNYFMPANAGEEFISIDQLKKCKISDFDWTGKDVYIGLDLAETEDNTAVAMLTYHEGKIVAKVWAFIPRERILVKSMKEDIDYQSEIKAGNCFGCGDEVIDYGYVEEFIMDLQEKYQVNIVQLGYDRRNALSSAQKLSNAGIECVEVIQHSRILHSPIKLLKECILNKNFNYEKNSLLEINFVNARQTEDTNLNKYLNKKKSKGKIDMVMALVDALYLLQERELLNQNDFVVQVI
ncbi:terminase large subunit [uncultured Clostridium sp.]|jgi:phage terminase large subunit-like protein|uniref:terminase large subunit n=1 Tax=uncultured Clostridium sp. TaxID=59620 RepID=UPI002059E620|nr:terminase TerL endonuclease subunit [uncultured Clostridium sp.]DAP98269.1 MAG TPA: Large Terminase [Caudoviricetes sp.]